MRDGFIKVAAGTPKIKVADCRHNAEQIFTLMREASRQGVRVLALPELCLTGATCGDLFFQSTLLMGARDGLATILDATKHLDMVTALGMPLHVQGKLYNCAVVIHKGEILSVVPKADLSPAQLRFFTPAPEGCSSIALCGQLPMFGSTVLFPCDSMPELTLAVEFGDSLCSFVPLSHQPAAAGANLILNLSALCDTVGGAARLRRAVQARSSRLLCGYVLAGAGEGESTSDAVCSGYSLIVENGEVLAQRRFACGLTVSEIDLSALAYERRRAPAFPTRTDRCFAMHFDLTPATTTLTRHFSSSPFVPEDPAELAERCNEIFKLTALGLKGRLEHTGAKAAVIGLSGGLDSTLAILTTTLAMKLLGRPSEDVIAVTMPCFGTTERTRDNAVELARLLGCTLRRIDIGETVKQHFRDIGQSMDNHDVTFENAQARERTQVLMDIANQAGGLVIGTGDLSELALGWCTYNGDHMSMYGVNAGIPKTLVRHLVRHVCGDKAISEPELASVLADILDTPVSPELLPAVNGTISQITEDLVGPYELHDFYLYYIVHRAFPPRKVLRLAEHAFGRAYDRATLLKWLRSFYRRFFSQQFKRSCMPDGPGVGPISLSPRGSWVMPSDAAAALWLDELEELE